MVIVVKGIILIGQQDHVSLVSHGLDITSQLPHIRALEGRVSMVEHKAKRQEPGDRDH